MMQARSVLYEETRYSQDNPIDCVYYSSTYMCRSDTFESGTVSHDCSRFQSTFNLRPFMAGTFYFLPFYFPGFQSAVILEKGF